MFFRALCDTMSKWENALRNTVLQYVIVALYSLLDLRLYSEPSFRSIFCCFFYLLFFLLFWAHVDSSDWCVACDCHLFMHQCSGIHWYYTNVYWDKSLQRSNVCFSLLKCLWTLLNTLSGKTDNIKKNTCSVEYRIILQLKFNSETVMSFKLYYSDFNISAIIIVRSWLYFLWTSSVCI